MTELEVESLEDSELHLSNLHLSVGVVRDVHEIRDGGGVNLLDLGDQEHGGHADKLQLSAGNATTLES